MALIRREVLRSFALLAAATCLPRQVQATSPSDGRFGLITLSSNGMTVSIYSLSRSALADASHLAGYERLDSNSYIDVPTPIHIAMAPGADQSAVGPTIDALVSRVNALLSKGVARSNIVVVTSNGFEIFASSFIPTIRAALLERANVALHVLNARDQARLQFDWVVPQKMRGHVFQLEINGSNIYGGYFDHGGSSGRYHDLSLPIGTKTMTAAVKRRWPETGTFDFPARSEQLYNEEVEGLLSSQAATVSGSQQFPTVILTGHIVRAAAVILHPHEMAVHRPSIDLQPDDFAKIRPFVEAGTPYGIVPENLSDSQRSSLLKTRSAIRSIFNPHQIAAGAALADGLSRQLGFTGRRLTLPILGSNGWGPQYLIEHFMNGGLKGAA